MSPTSTGRPTSAEHRPGEGATGRPSHHPEARGRLHARRRQRRQSQAADVAQGPPPGRHHHASQRCLRIRQDVDRGRCAGDGHRSSSGGHGGSDVRRQLALHSHRRALDPPFDPEFDPRSVLAGTDHQRHDARRAGPRGRCPRRRRHRDDREHQSAPRRSGRGGGAPGPVRGDRRSGQPDRGADLCVHAMHLHRLAAAVSNGGRSRLPVSAARGGDHLRDDRVVHPVPHPDTDRRELAVTRSGGGAAGPRPRQ